MNHPGLVPPPWLRLQPGHGGLWERMAAGGGLEIPSRPTRGDPPDQAGGARARASLQKEMQKELVELCGAVAASARWWLVLGGGIAGAAGGCGSDPSFCCTWWLKTVLVGEAERVWCSPEIPG